MKQQLTKKNIVHYFVAGSMVLVWFAIGFLLVTQSKANTTIFTVWDERMVTIPLGVQWPIESWTSQWFPISLVSSLDLSQESEIWRTNYEARMRYEIQEILSWVAQACALEQDTQAIEHIRTTLGGWWSLEISDTRCLTDTLSTRTDSSALIATKLPFIKVLARHHAWSDTWVRERVRTLDLQSRFEDASTWWSRSQYVTYAEAYWLLDRVKSDTLEPLQQVTTDEYFNLLGILPNSDRIILQDLLSLWLDQNPELNYVWRFAGKNWKLMNWLLREFQWATQKDQKVTIKKMLAAMEKKPDPLVEPLKERLILMLK